MSQGSEMKSQRFDMWMSGCDILKVIGHVGLQCFQPFNEESCQEPFGQESVRKEGNPGGWVWTLWQISVTLFILSGDL